MVVSSIAGNVNVQRMYIHERAPRSACMLASFNQGWAARGSSGADTGRSPAWSMQYLMLASGVSEMVTSGGRGLMRPALTLHQPFCWPLCSNKNLLVYGFHLKRQITQSTKKHMHTTNAITTCPNNHSGTQHDQCLCSKTAIESALGLVDACTRIHSPGRWSLPGS